jgi:Fe-coproporphyrin III synthase
MKALNQILRLLRYGFPQRRPARPLLVIFHITTRCNMACRHCGDDVWGAPRHDLPLEEIARLSESLGAVESLALGGGEPFLRPDLVEICRIFSGKNRVRSISIPSNGFAPTEICGKVTAILAACPDTALNVTLSLDGFEKTHDAIRTAGSFAKVLLTARALQSLIPASPQLSLSFNCTINNNNWSELPALAQFVCDEFGTRLQFNVLAGTPRDSGFTVPGGEDLEATLRALQRVGRPSRLRRVYDDLYREVLLQANFHSRNVVPCRAGSLVSLIDANGDVRSCPMLPPLGNLTSASFQEIWQGPQAWQQFRSISLGACACNNDCFIRLSLMNNWKLPFLMLRQLAQRGR